MSDIPQFVGSLTTEQLAALVRRCVRDELAERGYSAEQESMSKNDVAKLFGVTTRTVQSWMTREALPHKKGHGGRIMFQREEVATWAKEHGVAMKRKAA